MTFPTPDTARKGDAVVGPYAAEAPVHPRGGRLLVAWQVCGALILALWAAGALVLAAAPAWPPLIAVTQRPGILHALSFPQILLAFSAATTLWALLNAWWLRGHRTRQRVLTLTSNARILFSVVATLAWAWVWMFSSYGMVPRTGEAAEFTLAAFNAEGQLSDTDLQAIFGTHHADLAVISEWNDSAADDFARTRNLLAAGGLDPHNFLFAAAPREYGSFPEGVTLVWRADGSCAHVLPPAQETAANSWAPEQGQVTFGTVLFPGDTQAQEGEVSPTCPRVYGLHTMAPVGPLPVWRADLARIKDYAAAATAQGQPTVIVGDFNATTRHGPLLSIDGFVDALDVVPPWRRGTWNAHYPPLARTVIDHALISPHFAVSSAVVANGDYADHAMLIIGLRQQAPPPSSP